MHFNICFEGVSGKIEIFYKEKSVIEIFFLLRRILDFCYCESLIENFIMST